MTHVCTSLWELTSTHLLYAENRLKAHMLLNCKTGASNQRTAQTLEYIRAKYSVFKSKESVDCQHVCISNKTLCCGSHHTGLPRWQQEAALQTLYPDTEANRFSIFTRAVTILWCIDGSIYFLWSSFQCDLYWFKSVFQSRNGWIHTKSQCLVFVTSDDVLRTYLSQLWW